MEVEDGVHEEVGLRSTGVESLSIWHQRLGHVNYQTILKMVSVGCTLGLNSFNDQKERLPSCCRGCILGKMHRNSFPSGRHRASSVGELVHTDVCGPIEVPTPAGARFFVVFKDDYSGWCTTRILKNKSQVEEELKNFIADMKTVKGASVKTIRSDNGGEYMSNDLQSWLCSHGIRHETSVPYTPQQNGVAERTMRTVVEAARSMLYNKQVPLQFWGEAVMCATYLLNRSLSSTNKVTPFEIWYHRKPDVSHLRVFGSVAYAHVPDALRKKLDPKAVECRMVGYSETSKAYRLWNPNTRRVILSRDVIFQEETVGEVAFPPEEKQSSQVYVHLFPGVAEEPLLVPDIDQPREVEEQPVEVVQEPLDMPAPIQPVEDGAEPPPELVNHEDDEDFHGFEETRRRSGRATKPTERMQLYRSGCYESTLTGNIGSFNPFIHYTQE